MSIRNLKTKITPYLKNLGGWTTNRKIVVIESDDWGSIRMPSREVYEKCLKSGYRVDRSAYEKYDSLASEQDLELLFELLLQFKDKNGNHPIITANSLVANPNFVKIKASDFNEYHYELITDTFKRYPKHNHCFELWKEGMKQNLFFSQSHGREHLNVSLFMNSLQQKDRDVLFGFEHEIPGGISRDGIGGNQFVKSLDYSSEKDKLKKLKIILEGLKLFEELFGYRSETFIPPNYLWSPDYDEAVKQAGVYFFQGNRRMKELQLNGGGGRMHTRMLGEKNKYGQRYLVRNAIFEPTLFKMKVSDPVELCLHQINAAFRMRKPAIICSHRINYVGYLDPGNRDRTLKMLNELLQNILKKWPEMEFMTSVQLGQLISGGE